MVLVLILMFGLLPMAAFADNDVEDPAPAEASETIPEANENETEESAE